MFIYLIIAVIVLLIIYVIKTVNKLNLYKMKVEESSSSVDIMIDKRYNVLTESLKVAKSYAKHEKDVFSNLLRREDSSRDEVLSSQNDAISNLLAVGNMYPELKSNELFSKLMTQLAQENEHFSAAKRAYNASVTSYNKIVTFFPSCIIALVLGFNKEDYIKERDIDTKRDFSLDFEDI